MLTLDWSTIFFELLNFILLAWLLNRFVFKPVIATVQARSAEKARLLVETRAAKAAVEESEAAWQERLAMAEAEAHQILATARETADRARHTIIQSAYETADEIVNNARAEAERRHQAALLQHQTALVETILHVSREVIQHGTPEGVHEALVEGLNGRIWELGREDLVRVQAIRAALADQEPVVYIHSAQPLTTEQQRLLARTFAAFVDRGVTLEVEVDPSLGAGLRARIGDLMVENSLADQLEALREDVESALAKDEGNKRNGF